MTGLARAARAVRVDRPRRAVVRRVVAVIRSHRGADRELWAGGTGTPGPGGGGPSGSGMGGMAAGVREDTPAASTSRSRERSLPSWNVVRNVVRRRVLRRAEPGAEHEPRPIVDVELPPYAGPEVPLPTQRPSD
ncbi:hypothetical protein [Actinopolymorpha pittospori]|nr:hypothetical protein [Actinopolymorpha pittospori]